jgi:heme-degrading monooxygenase HmoA
VTTGEETTMLAVIFEVYPTRQGKKEYLELAVFLKNELSAFEGLLSIERFQSLIEEGKLLSLSFWQDEASLEKWRNFMDHRLAQQKGKNRLFSSYRIRVCSVVRDYTESERAQAPNDSNRFHS